MRFRPCIDIHNGKVKQIVGGSLNDTGLCGKVRENYVSEASAAYYALLYKSLGLKGGHIIFLNRQGTDEYDADINQAKEAFAEYPGGFQAGGGITCDNAESILDMGASHVIVTSYVFKDGKVYYDNLKKLKYIVGKEHLVIDLSCRKQGNDYYVVTDRWQRFTDVKLSEDVITMFSEYCDEFLVHAVDVEGKASGIEPDVVTMLGRIKGIPVTYAGGIASCDDISEIARLGRNNVDFTVGSALDIFGGTLSLNDIAKKYC